MSEGEHPSTGGLWRNRDYRAVWIGQGISNLGDGVSATALPLLVLMLTGSGVQMGLVGALERLPEFVFSLAAGALADRWDRRRTMLFCDLGRAALVALIPLSVLLGIPTMTVVYLVAAPLGLLGVLFRASYTAAIPKLVEREEVAAANSYFEAVESAAWIAGPALAGALVAWVGAGLTLALDAASFLLSAVALAAVRRPLGGEAKTAEGRTALLREIREGVLYVCRNAKLRAAISLWAAGRSLAAPLVPALAFFVTVDRQLSASHTGLLVSVYAAGSLAGTLSASRVARRERTGRIMIAACALTGVALLVVAQAKGMALMLFGSCLYGAAEGLMLVAYLTLRAVATPNRMLGRVGGTADTVVLGGATLGLLCGGALLSSAGGGLTLSVMGGGLLVVAVLFSFSTALRSRQ